MSSVDTVVVGAGPAGAAAAHKLASAGRDVLLVDKATFPRDKFCGDGLTTLCLRQLELMGVSVSQLPSFAPVHGAKLRSPGGRLIDVPLPEGPGLFAAVARRTELDSLLVEHALAAGATGRFGVKVVEAEASADDITITTDDGQTITANQCIAADGMWSPIRKLLGLEVDGYRGEWHAFRQYFENVDEQAQTGLWIWFEPDVLPGYVWSFPIGGGRANVGFGILRGGDVSTQQMKTLWPDLLARPHIREVLGADAAPESPHRAWPIPARINGVPLTGPRTLFVGDAAAACDTLTGEGIGQALLTGRAAADALLESPQFTTAAANYRDAIDEELFADHKMAEICGGLLGNRNVAEAALTMVGATGWTRRNFGRWMFEDYPRAILATPRRWRRGMFTGSGAST